MYLRYKPGSVLLLCFLVVVICADAEAQGDLRLLTVDRDSHLLSTVDPISGFTISTETITLSGQTVLGAAGLAKDPTNGDLYALLILDPPSNRVRRLVRVNPADGTATNIGPANNGTGLVFADITFSSDGVLYGVTGDSAQISAPSPETLFQLDKSTGNATMVKTLGNGDSGEAIAFNPGDNLLYHASGFSDTVFEKVDPALPSVPVNIPLSVDATSEPISLVHLRGDFFLWGDFNGDLYLVNRNGSVRFLSTLDHRPAGLAFIGSPVPCPPNPALYGSAHQGPDGPALLYSLDPGTGAASLIGPIGLERVGGIAFRSDGTLFGVGERMNGSNTTMLSTIDPCSGLATEIGPVNRGNLTDISFRQSDGVLFAMFVDFSQDSMRVMTLNTANGQGSTVGLTGTLGLGNGMAFNAANVLFHADDFLLSDVDQGNAALTTLIPLTFSISPDERPRVNALDFQPGSGTLFGAVRDDTGTNFLTTVDTSNGNVDTSTATPTQAGLDGIAFARTNVAATTADLAVTNVDDADPITAGNILNYTIVVTNDGPGAAHNVVLSDQLPGPLRNATATPTQGSCSQGTNVICNLGTIDPGPANSVTVTINATVVVSASGSITNMATVQAASSDPTPGNNSAGATTTITAAPTADLEVTSFGHLAGAVAVGAQASFTAVARNNGGASADANLSFVFPVRMSGLSGPPGCVSDSTSITCDLGTLAPAEIASVTVMGAPPFVRSIRPVANALSSLTNDTNGSNNSRTADTSLHVRPRPLAREGLELRLP